MESVFGKNQSVADALDAYLELERPQFAVLIDSPWGSGKTWFIRKYFEEKRKEMDSLAEREINKNKEKPVFCYVSLFDITDAKEIDSSIIAESNPLFSTKSVKRWGRLARFAVEKSISYLPIEDPEKISQIISNTLQQLCSNRPDNLVVCLDDIERSRIPIEIIFGYVSSLLEDADAKVIIVCNTNGFMSENRKIIFDSFKEKVVGLNLCINDDNENVFEDAINLIKNENVKIILRKNKENIFNIYEKSSTRNLRHIRRLMFEFLYLYESLPKDSIKNNYFISDILRFLFSLSIELHSNRNIVENVDWESEQWFGSISTQDDESRNIFSKYQLDLWLGVFHPKFWWNFLVHGIIDRNYLLKYYKYSQYNPNKEHAPLPIQLWHYHDMDDDEFNLLYKRMIREMRDRKYTDSGIILHAYSLLLAFSYEGLKDIDRNKIVERVYNYCKDIEFEKLDNESILFSGERNAYQGLGFHYHAKDEFKEIYNIVKHQYVKSVTKATIEDYKNVFHNMKDNLNELIELPIFDKKNIDLANILFYNLNYSVFAHEVCRLSNKEIQLFSDKVSDIFEYGINSRYNIYVNKEDIKIWIDNFCISLERYSEDMKPLAKQSVSRWIARLRELTKAYISMQP